MRPIALGAGLAGLIVVVVGCTATNIPTVPTMPPIATSVQAAFQGTTMVFTVSPWRLDATVAFLCRSKPGPEFTIDSPKPAAAAGCVPLESSTSGNVLQARFDALALAPGVADLFNDSGPPWFLAVSGKRDPFSAATTLTVIDSPIYSPHGPS